jgi:DNA-binding LacI/PurR family transcriptional regulator
MVSFVVDDDISFVGTDHEEGGFIATDHLIKLGYKRIGYINGEEGNLVGEARKKGFLKAIQQAGLQFNTNDEFRLRLRGESFDYDSGYEIGEQFARKNDRPEALFIYNDLSTLGFQKAVFDNQLSVPEDIGIVGFDDIKRGVTAPVPLTTVHQPTDEIGALSVEILLRRIQGESIAPRHILKPSLVVRSSCGAKLKASKEAGGL